MKFWKQKESKIAMNIMSIDQDDPLLLGYNFTDAVLCYCGGFVMIQYTWEEDDTGNWDDPLTPIQTVHARCVTAQLSKHKAQKSPGIHLSCDSMLLTLKYDLWTYYA